MNRFIFTVVGRALLSATKVTPIWISKLHNLAQTDTMTCLIEDTDHYTASALRYSRNVWTYCEFKHNIIARCPNSMETHHHNRYSPSSTALTDEFSIPFPLRLLIQNPTKLKMAEHIGRFWSSPPGKTWTDLLKAVSVLPMKPCEAI